MADTNTSQANIQGSLPLYKKPVPLNSTEHKDKGLKFNDRPFDFLHDAHFVPLTVGEFGPACGTYPIIFIGETKTAVAAMGMRQGENLFVDPDTAQFDRHTYIPAFVRRYPFVAASHSQEDDRFTVCIDEGSHLFSDNPDESFFDQSGQPTEFTQRAIDYVRRFETDVRNTQAFVKAMDELGLFTQQEAKFQPRDAQGQPVGEPRVVANYWGIDGGKLRELEPSKLAELRDNTYLGAIYAHMLSQAQWDYLIQRAAERQNGGQPAGGGEIAPPPAPEA